MSDPTMPAGLAASDSREAPAMTPRSIDRPGVPVADMVTVERSVLVTLLARLASYADEYPGDDAMTYYRMANEVESGARDRLTAAEFEGSGE